MAVGSFHDVRSAYTIAVPYEITVRYITTAYVTGNERIIMPFYSLSSASSRKCLCMQNMHQTERWCFKPRVVYIYDSNKLCFTPAAEVNFALRWCTYSLGSSNIIYTFPTVLAITYTNDRKCFVEKNIVSNRFVLVKYYTGSDRAVQACIREETRVYTPKALLAVQTNDERTCFYDVGGYSQRQLSLLYTVQDERNAVATLERQVKIYTPQAALSLLGLYTEKTCIVGQSLVHSDRRCWFLTSQMTERFINTKYTITNERFVTFYIGRINKVYTCIATPSRLVASERFVFTVGFAYKTERYAYSEMRPLWYKKTPLASSPILNVRSILDKNASIKITNDRDLELHGFTGDIEKLDALNKHTIINDTEENILQVSAVDNTGAMVNSLSNKEKKLVASQVFEIIVTSTLDGGSASDDSNTVEDGGDANNNSTTIYDGG